MSSPFLAEVRIFPYNFAPRGWAACDGQILGIAQNTALFSLLGITYGGNGQTTFALPDLRGRATNSRGQGPGLSPYDLGEQFGTPTVTLGLNQMPAHRHPLNAATLSPLNQAQNVPTPSGTTVMGISNPGTAYSSVPTPAVAMATEAIQGVVGGNQPHKNDQPYLAFTFCIAMEGIFPTRN
ncbi:phage tail protein [Sphingomonas sp. So64.6b]|uniref:phage tail protein n=1 Tax=Sphingomonas sp. So64.6b TaxID=2997354 RepID=UPI0015FF9A59|nr:tail fiber protein [Sphingomonas sp. So64.6b]QNA83312.1 phage tail protein [Sphingomonas sp. So64.6b]